MSNLLRAITFALAIALTQSAFASNISAFTDSELRSLVIEEFGPNYYANRVSIYSEDRPQVRRIARTGLHEAEVVSLQSYFFVGFTDFNKCLRADMVPAECKSVEGRIEAVHRGLGHLPNFVGRVIRTTNLPEAFLNQHVPGAVVVYRGFTSTSSKPDRVYGKQKFVIESKSGKAVSWLSQLPEENEVLFDDGAKFQVTRVEGSTEPGVSVVVFMTEVL